MPGMNSLVRARLTAEVLDTVRKDLRARGLVAEEQNEHGQVYVIVDGEIECIVGLFAATHRPGVVVEARHADRIRRWRPSTDGA